MNKKYISGFLLLIGMLLAYLGYQTYERSNTQTVLIRAVSKDSIGSKDSISDTIHLETVSVGEKLLSRNNIIPGFNYQVTVRYSIVKKNGSGLFSKRGSDANIAYLGCSELETTQMVTATKKFLAIDLALVVKPEDIVDSQGKTFDPKTMKLKPIISIERQGNG